MKALLLLSFAAVSTLGYAETDAQASFNTVKGLAGEWEGVVTTTPPTPSVQGTTAHITIRVTSRGNAVLHEMKNIGDRPDNPITMIYLEQDQLRLTHYCDAGNRPRMEALPSKDGKRIEFGFVDVSGGTEKGHMHNTTFTPIDADHHIEEWTYMSPDGKGHVVARFDVRRTK